jgi:hypothetical protein
LGAKNQCARHGWFTVLPSTARISEKSLPDATDPAGKTEPAVTATTKTIQMLMEKLKQKTGTSQELVSGPIIHVVVDTVPIDDWQMQSSPAKPTRRSIENPVASYQKNDKSGQDPRQSNDRGTKKKLRNRHRDGAISRSH